MENTILMNDSLLWKSLPLSEQQPQNHATNFNNLILLNKIYLMCFNVWFSLWFMLLVVRCVVQLTFDVARDFISHANLQFCYLKNRKVKHDSQVVQKTLNNLPASRTMVALDKGESYCNLLDSNGISIIWIQIYRNILTAFTAAKIMNKGS